MYKKINDFLAGLPMTLLGGIFLILSFVLPRAGISLPVDPAWATIFISGIPLLYLAVWRIIYNPGIRKISSALLITIAMFAAIAIGDIFAAGEVVFIMAIGAILEDMTTNRAKKGLQKLLSLAPAKGRRIKNGKEEIIPANEIQVDDLLRVLPGETIPIDGIILSGESSVDQSIMTGESLPVDKSMGDSVFCGTLNCFGAIDIRATKIGEDSSLQKMIRLVQEAEEKQAPMQRIADKWASFLVPIASLIAILAGLITQDLVRAVTVLVVFCPCALVLATPTAIMAAIGQATKHGVIIKSGEALEKMGKIHTIAFDKTGTLTMGKLTVSDVVSCDPSLTENELLALCASAEQKSEHPLAKAIVSCAKERNLFLMESASFRMTSGKGISATLNGNLYYCGNETYLKENGIEWDESLSKMLQNLHSQGKATILMGKEKTCIGILAFSDLIRPEAKEMIAKLSAMNTDTLLLTGDNSFTANYFSSRIGIRKVYASLLPEEKMNMISSLQKNGTPICMIGDGVNDAPALKAADVGVAMGSMGSDIAIEAADIALMSDDIQKIPYLKRLSNATVNTIKFSISLSMCINFVAVALSVLGILTPTTGALVHNAGSCLVVLIAALLYDRNFDRKK